MEIAATDSTSPLVIPSQGDAQRAEHASEESLASLRILGRKWQIPRWRVANAPLARNDTLERDMEIAATNLHPLRFAHHARRVIIRE